MIEAKKVLLSKRKQPPRKKPKVGEDSLGSSTSPAGEGVNTHVAPPIKGLPPESLQGLPDTSGMTYHQRREIYREHFVQKLYLGTITREELNWLEARSYIASYMRKRREVEARKARRMKMRIVDLRTRWLEYQIIYRNMGDRAPWVWTVDEYEEFFQSTYVLVLCHKKKFRTIKKGEFFVQFPRKDKLWEQTKGMAPEFKMFSLWELLRMGRKVIVKPLERAKGFSLGNLYVTMDGLVIYTDHPSWDKVVLPIKEHSSLSNGHNRLGFDTTR